MACTCCRRRCSACVSSSADIELLLLGPNSRCMLLAFVCFSFLYLGRLVVDAASEEGRSSSGNGSRWFAKRSPWYSDFRREWLRGVVSCWSLKLFRPSVPTRHNPQEDKQASASLGNQTNKELLPAVNLDTHSTSGMASQKRQAWLQSRQRS